MANEITTAVADDLLFVSWFSDRVLDELRPYSVAKPLLRYEGRRPTMVMNFALQDDPGAAASNQTQGTAFTNTAITTSRATATARLNGQVVTLNDVARDTSFIDEVSHFAAMLGRSCAEEYEVTIAALYDDFTNSTGTSGADLTIAQFLDAISQLEQRDAVGSLVAVLHPVQVGDLRAGVASSTGAWYGGEAGTRQANIVEAKLAGYAGNLFGVDIFMTSAVATANGAADRAGAIFVRGEALGLYEVWDTRLETHRDAFQPGTQIAATSVYGVVMIRDAWGQEVTTDA